MIKRTFSLLLFLFIIAASYAQDSLKIGFSVGDFSSDRWSQEPQIFNEAAKSWAPRFFLSMHTAMLQNSLARPAY